MNEAPSITDELDMIESFGADIAGFFHHWESQPLLTQMPVKDLDATATSRLVEGRYLLRPCGCSIRPVESGFLMSELFALLRKHLPDRTAGLDAIEQQFLSGQISVTDFVQAVLKNDGNQLRTMMRQHDIPEDLVTFLAVYVARPYRVQMARFLLEGVDLAVWSFGYCPVCGHWPSLAHIGGPETMRMLWCLHCDTRWKFKRLQCAFCLNEDQEEMEFISLPENDAYRLHVCNKCRRYLKEIKSSDAPEDVAFDTVYLGTMLLDVAAEREHYIQESPLTVRYDDPDGNELLVYRQHDLAAGCGHRY